ncbi:MAG: diacylglycerol kinase family protein [Spirulinaceae cyanobacterium RM2_2_10]|nr:diacylglycerol kinase family protein [Spirulinaceae cyanobacterium SM2_1_0]NJO20643.1 diacylglycerol kinase family protein [Spirulinaceae cyanobacterium RM2_2_10]
MKLDSGIATPSATAPHPAFLTALTERSLAFSSAELSDPTRPFTWQVAPNLFRSFQYAWAGVRYAFVTQRNFRIHTVIASLAISLCLALQIGTTKTAVVGLTCALVMALELLNTALESVVDLTVRNSYHELAKIAKDCAAGAVLVAAIASIFVAGLLLVPPLLQFILAAL